MDSAGSTTQQQRQEQMNQRPQQQQLLLQLQQQQQLIQQQQQQILQLQQLQQQQPQQQQQQPEALDYSTREIYFGTPARCPQCLMTILREPGWKMNLCCSIKCQLEYGTADGIKMTKSQLKTVETRIHLNPNYIFRVKTGAIPNSMDRRLVDLIPRRPAGEEPTPTGSREPVPPIADFDGDVDPGVQGAVSQQQAEDVLPGIAILLERQNDAHGFGPDQGTENFY